MEGILQTDFHFPKQSNFYRGKVRDVYYFGDRMVIVTTDRLSAFDTVMPQPIPYKGHILHRMAAHFLEASAEMVPNWLENAGPYNAAIGRYCEPFPVEMVVRGYLEGHAWREYKAGKRMLCGMPLPDGMRRGEPFPSPIITPTTKAKEGHDQAISREQILRQGLVSEKDYTQMEFYALRLFEQGTAMAQDRDLLLVDTKYEFGRGPDGRIYLIDEVHTPDSSRYYYADSYEYCLYKGLPQRQLSKEFAREWLMERGFQGRPGQAAPELDEAFVNAVSERYIELYEKITGKPFDPKLYDYSIVLSEVEAFIRETIG